MIVGSMTLLSNIQRDLNHCSGEESKGEFVFARSGIPRLVRFCVTSTK
jgi:hypothetical protein